MDDPNFLVDAGLALDIVGALLLAWGLAFSPEERYVREEGVWGYAAGDLARGAEGARAIVGASLLGVGFLSQGLSASGLDGSSAAWFLLLLFVPLAWASLGPVRRLRERRIILARARQDARSRGNDASWGPMLDQYAEALEISDRGRRAEENRQQHLDRIYGSRFHDQVRSAAENALLEKAPTDWNEEHG